MRKDNDLAGYHQHTVLIIGVIVVISVLGFIMLRKKKYDLKQMEEKRKILETPIDNLEDEDLKNKIQRLKGDQTMATIFSENQLNRQIKCQRTAGPFRGSRENHRSVYHRCQRRVFHTFKGHRIRQR